MKNFEKTIIFIALALSVAMTLSSCGALSTTIKSDIKANKVPTATVGNTKQVSILPLQLGITDKTDPADIINYAEIARNRNSIFYADIANGHFALQNINTEEIWYDVPNNTELDEITSGTERMEVRSQLLLRYILKTEENTVSSYKVETSQSCVRKGNVKSELFDGGIKVTYNFVSCGITVPVKYYLTNDAFRAEIIAEEIDEGETSYLIGINLLPAFGAGHPNADGYLFLPDGSGAIVNFKHHNNMQVHYENMVYGAEKAVNQVAQTFKSEQIRMPVFGTSKGDDALMGIITDGDADASITAMYYSNVYGYTSASSVFNFRIVDTKNMFAKQGGISNTLYRVSKIKAKTKIYSVEYSLLDGKDSGYMGMALKYRDYLKQNKLLEQKKLQPQFNIEVYGTADLTTSFLGFKYTSSKVLTTFSQTEKILSELKTNGIKNIGLRYVGFSGDGLLNMKINTSVSPIQKLGSKKQFISLEESAEIFPDYDLIRVRKSGNGISLSNDVLHTVFNYKASQHTFSHATNAKKTDDVFLLNGQAILGSANKLASIYKKSGYGNISLSLLGSTLYSNCGSDKMMYRDETYEYVKQSIKNLSDNSEKMALESANAYAFKFADKIWNTPIYSSGYDIFEKDVPFYQIVVHGSVSTVVPPIIQSDEPKITILKAVETGSELMFSATYEESTDLIGSRYEEYYSTSYKNWLDYATQINKKYSPILAEIYNKQITKHYELTDGVFITRFGDVDVAVNYNNKAVVMPNGKTLNAFDFCKLNGECRE